MCNVLLSFLVHRIGRTGRSGRTGIATTFINKANDESVLLDLKHLLMEAKQKVPPFLLELCSENEKYLNLGGRIIVDDLYFFLAFISSHHKFTVLFIINLKIFFSFCYRRTRLQLLRWTRTQDHRVSEIGGCAE